MNELCFHFRIKKVKLCLRSKKVNTMQASTRLIRHDNRKSIVFDGIYHFLITQQ